ncbi:proline--tRNA ligase [Sulfodiicoccus acidiphilus]|nr:proline--tRNA ligase [Sulfodiicoccus acidiphilus]
MPYGFKIRERVLANIRNLLNETGHEEVLFPLLVPETLLAKEAEHIEGFQGEVFWVTKGGNEELDVKLALRPTSEVSITYMENLWIKGYTQLPKKYYQIVSVFRYETKATRPLLRVREITTFKEAHTIHESYEDAERQVREAISIYKKFFDSLGIPYVISVRPEWDKFAGALYTVAFDTIFPDGRVVQIGTVHHLGQNFTKAFDMKIQRADGSLDYPHQTSYGISDRAIAAIIAIHGDDHGAVLHPLVAPILVVVIPIPAKEEGEKVKDYARKIAHSLNSAGIITKIDDNEKATPGEKYYYWELRGVPLRVEVGRRELASKTVSIKRRDTLESKEVELNHLIDAVREILKQIEDNMRTSSWKRMKDLVSRVDDLNLAKSRLESKLGIVEVPWCGNNKCGLKMEEQTGGRVLGSPYEGAEIQGKCVVCGSPAETVLRIAKTY